MAHLSHSGRDLKAVLDALEEHGTTIKVTLGSVFGTPEEKVEVNIADYVRNIAVHRDSLLTDLRAIGHGEKVKQKWSR
jgi:hypothetical protein